MGNIGTLNGTALNLDRRGLLAAIAASVAASGAPAFGRSEPYPAVKALLDAYVAEGLVPGAVVAGVRPGKFAPVSTRSGKSQFEGGSTVDEDTLWRVYSMTKTVTGMAIMQQIAAGKLTIDTPIAEIMPEFAQMRVATDPEKSLDAVPATKPIRVRHLLTHTAGFTYAFFTPNAVIREYQRLGLQPMSSSTLGLVGTPAPDLKTYMERLATVPLLFEPGSKYHYSISLDVAGALLERLTGKTLDRIFAEQIFEPLGMDDTAFWLSASQMKRLAGLYSWRGEGYKLLDKPVLVDSQSKSDWAGRPIMLSGGAGLISSADNFARFGQMLLNEGMFEGKRVLPQSTARLAMANLMEPGTLMSPTEGYGAGGRSIIGQAVGPDVTKYGVEVWGWGGAASTLFHVDPIRGQAVVLMLQSLGNEKGPNERRLNTALASDFAR